MTQTRSVYSWDVIIRKTDKGLIFDKRDHNQLETYFLNENCELMEEDEAIQNSMKDFDVQTLGINRMF
jgi:hypothetical protein